MTVTRAYGPYTRYRGSNMVYDPNFMIAVVFKDSMGLLMGYELP